MRGIDELKYFEKYIKQSIKDNDKGNVCYLCKVKAYNDNFSVDVVLENGKNVSLELSNIPILQSAYYQPFCQKGDLGLVLPLNNSIYNTLISKENLYAEGECEYIFIPLVKKDNVLQGNGEILGIKSPAGDIVNVGKEKIECVSKDISVKGNDSINIATKEAIIKADSSIAIESAQTSIKSTSPLELSATESLGSLLSDLIDILNALTTTNAVVGSPCALNPATIALLTALQTRIKASFK